MSSGTTGSVSQTLTFISIFFKDGLEKFEVNRKVQLSNKKSGFRIDAEKTANRLLEGIATRPLLLGESVTLSLVIARQTPMLEELSGPSKFACIVCKCQF